MKKKPGVMLYFDLKRTVDRLSDKHAGILLRAILEYGLTGTVPELPDKLFLLWPMIQMRLDVDDERYYQLTYKRKYAAYVRWENEHGREPLSYKDWACTEALAEEEASLPC